jgi:hypothetical protein
LRLWSALLKPRPVESIWRIAPSPSSMVTRRPCSSGSACRASAIVVPGSRQSGKPDAKAVRDLLFRCDQVDCSHCSTPSDFHGPKR